MREIKFRAWHFKLGKMFSAEEMTSDQLALLPDGHFANIDGTSTKLSHIYAHDKIIPLQFTGLKDRNGKEIYEGDIIKIKNHSSQIQKIILRGVVVFNFASFGIEIKQVEQWKGYTVEPPQIYWFLNSIDKDFEVTGNIYENPELLK